MEAKKLDEIQPPAPVKVVRRPGRPPKKRPDAPVPDVIGILEQPRNPDAVMEMAYCNPIIFKKLFVLFKSYEVADVEFIFTPTNIKIVAKDHYNKATIYATIDGSKMNCYYCRDTYRVCIKRDMIEKVLGNIDKDQIKVGFSLKENSYRSAIFITVRDCQYDKINAYEVETAFKPNVDGGEPEQIDDSNYPIRFVLESKHFKSEITKVSKMSSTITIRKEGSNPLQFIFDEAKKINYQGTYNDSAKIKLESTIAEDDILNTSIMIDYIKPFSNAAIGDEVIIAADKYNKLSMLTYLDKKGADWVCSVKVFVEIKTNRAP
jgi:hypothetical protein